MQSLSELRLDSSDNDSFGLHLALNTFKHLDVTPNGTVNELAWLQHMPQPQAQCFYRAPTLMEEGLVEGQEYPINEGILRSNFDVSRGTEHLYLMDSEEIRLEEALHPRMDPREDTELYRRIANLGQVGQKIDEELIFRVYRKMTGGKELGRYFLEEFVKRHNFMETVWRQPCDGRVQIYNTQGRYLRVFDVPRPEKPSPDKSTPQEIYMSSQSGTPMHIKVEHIALPDTQLSLQTRYDTTQRTCESAQSARRNRKYNMLSTQEKQRIVRECTFLSINQVAKKHGISINNICRWRKRCERKSGAGRKVHDPKMEEQLLKWIDSVGTKVVVTRQLIRRKAIELSGDDTFKASKGWFERFMNRNRDLIRKSGYGTKLPHPVKREPSTSIVKIEQ